MQILLDLLPAILTGLASGGLASVVSWQALVNNLKTKKEVTDLTKIFKDVKGSNISAVDAVKEIVPLIKDFVPALKEEFDKIKNDMIIELTGVVTNLTKELQNEITTSRAVFHQQVLAIRGEAKEELTENEDV